MIDGTYSLKIGTPLGPRRGRVIMRTKGDKTIADINAPVVGIQRIEVQTEGDTFSADGSFRMLFVGKVSYSLRGKVEGDKIRISIDSSKGTFNLTGKRV